MLDVANMIQVENCLNKLIFNYFLIIKSFNKQSIFLEFEFSDKYFMVQALQG